MKSSTKLITTAVASILGVALAGGAAYAATGSLTVSDAPGQVLKVSGVGPASTHASETAMTHANANAKGLFGSDGSAEAGTEAENEVNSDSSTSTVTPIEPRVASKDASTVKGSETGKSISEWAHTKTGVETVAPGAAVSVDASIKGRG